MANPTEINVHKKSAILELTFDNGSHFELPAEYLRVFSPSAEVQGHGPGQSVLQHGKKDIKFRDLEPQGHYAVRITFSDGHDSGIYSWKYLLELGENQERYWADYLHQLETAGKTREALFIAVNRT